MIRIDLVSTPPKRRNQTRPTTTVQSLSSGFRCTASGAVYLFLFAAMGGEFFLLGKANALVLSVALSAPFLGIYLASKFFRYLATVCRSGTEPGARARAERVEEGTVFGFPHRKKASEHGFQKDVRSSVLAVTQGVQKLHHGVLVEYLLGYTAFTRKDQGPFAVAGSVRSGEPVPISEHPRVFGLFDVGTSLLGRWLAFWHDCT